MLVNVFPDIFFDRRIFAMFYYPNIDIENSEPLTNLIASMNISTTIDYLLTANRIFSQKNNSSILSDSEKDKMFITYQNYVISKSRFDVLPDLKEENCNIFYPESLDRVNKNTVMLKYSLRLHEKISPDQPIPRYNYYIGKIVNFLSVVFTPKGYLITSQHKLYPQYIEINQLWRLLNSYYKQSNNILNDYQIGFSRLFNFFIYLNGTQTKVKENIMYVYMNVLFLGSSSANSYNVIYGLHILPFMYEIYPLSLSGYYGRNFVLPVLMDNLVIKPYFGFYDMKSFAISICKFMRNTYYIPYDSIYIQPLLSAFNNRIEMFFNDLYLLDLINESERVLSIQLLTLNVNSPSKYLDWMKEISDINVIEYVLNVFQIKRKDITINLPYYEFSEDFQDLTVYSDKLQNDMNLGRLVLIEMIKVAFKYMGIPFSDGETINDWPIISPIISQAYLQGIGSLFYQTLNIDTDEAWVFDNQSESMISSKHPIYYKFGNDNSKQYKNSTIDTENTNYFIEIMKIQLVVFYFFMVSLDSKN